MRGILAAILIWLSLSLGAQAQEAEIRDTISRQFDAFRADDFATAFGFASPTLQMLFATPENFREMVTRGYPMVWRNAEVRFLEMHDEAGRLWQKVRITDKAGKVHVLDYQMIETPEGWRIGGVQILDSSGLSA